MTLHRRVTVHWLSCLSLMEYERVGFITAPGGLAAQTSWIHGKLRPLVFDASTIDGDFSSWLEVAAESWLASG